MMVTLKQLDNGRENNFDLTRFIAATLVIFSHSFWLTGNEANEPLGKLVWLINFGSLGLKIFFAISGYLIIKSLYRQHTLQSFVWARSLRIFPGLFVTSLFCVFIIGPLCTVLPLSSYFSNTALFSFVWRETTLHNYPNSLPGVFLSNPVPNNVNSPIWTLPGELLMYLCVLLWGVVLLIREKRFKPLTVIPLLIVVFAFYWGIPYSGPYMHNIFSWGILFFSGMACYLFSNKIIISIPLFIGMVIAFFILFHYRFIFIEPVFDVVLTYGILIFAYHPKLQVKSFHKLGDFSYGLYIYALPIQQMVIQKIPALKPIAHFFISYTLALFAAILSWYFVEKPMLKLKTVKLSAFNKFYVK